MDADFMDIYNFTKYIVLSNGKNVVYVFAINKDTKEIYINETNDWVKFKKEYSIRDEQILDSSRYSLQTFEKEGYKFFPSYKRMYESKPFESEFAPIENGTSSVVKDQEVMLVPPKPEQIKKENRKKVVRTTAIVIGMGIIATAAAIGLQQCGKNKNVVKTDSTVPSSTIEATTIPSETTTTITEAEVVIPTELIERVSDPRMDELKLQFEAGELSFDLSDKDVLAAKFQEFYKNFEGSTVSVTEALVYFLAANDMRIEDYDFTIVDQYINKVNIAITQYEGVNPDFT